MTVVLIAKITISKKYNSMQCNKDTVYNVSMMRCLGTFYLLMAQIDIVVIQFLM